VERDFSFVFGQDVSFERIRAAVAGLKLAELRAFRPVETFRGGAIPAGKYSLLLRATFQSGERTLRDDEVAAWAGRIVKALKTLGGTLRA
jgi:phenylalanyl-tRNA synthetase beta chain